MGLGHVIAAAAAAAPAVRNYMHRRSRSDDSDGTIIPSRPLHIPPGFSLPREPDTPTTDEMARRPLLVDTHTPSRQSSSYSHNAGPTMSYGAIPTESPTALRASPERHRRDSWLDRVPEEATVDQEELEEEDEWDLAELGYYSGELLSYKTHGARHPIVGVLSWYGSRMLGRCMLVPRKTLSLTEGLGVLVRFSSVRLI